MEKFIIADGTAIRIGDTLAGDRTVVLLHGFLENLNVWDDLTGLLQPHVRVIAPDLPGHGISEVRGPVHSMEFLADVVYEALVQSGVAKCTVTGHSMGGYVALALAERHPEILDGLVLFSSTPNADSDAKRLDRQREIAIVEGGKKELLSRTLPGRGFAPQNRARFADEIEDFAEIVMLTEDEGITALLRGMAERPDRNEMLGGLAVPQLFMLGRHDEYITSEIAETMISRQPQARVVWLENSGHNGFIEEPPAAAEAILDFLGANNNKKQYDMKKIAIAADHAGFEMKEYLVGLLSSMDYDVFDFGCYSEEPCDYPDVAHPLADAVAAGEFSRGISVCGSGVGISMAVNRHKGVRGALCWSAEIAELSRKHNDANVLCLPGRFMDNDTARRCVELFLATEFEGGRHQRRVEKIDDPSSISTPAK